MLLSIDEKFSFSLNFICYQRPALFFHSCYSSFNKQKTNRARIGTAPAHASIWVHTCYLCEYLCKPKPTLMTYLSRSLSVFLHVPFIAAQLTPIFIVWSFTRLEFFVSNRNNQDPCWTPLLFDPCKRRPEMPLWRRSQTMGKMTSSFDIIGKPTKFPSIN